MSAPSYRVTFRTCDMHIAAEWQCAAVFATESDARVYAMDLAGRPTADGVQVYRRNVRIWEDPKCRAYRAMSMGGGE